MTVYIVRYTHPDVPGWRTQLEAHTKWLLARLADGTLKASGPLKSSADGEREALLVLVADDRAALDRIIATDPYAIYDLISGMDILEWDPLFGAFQPESSLPTMLRRIDWSPYLAGLDAAGALSRL